MRTFITQRALAASPLMVGGDLPTMDDYSLSLLTNEEMLACNQNGNTGTLIKESDELEVWGTCIPSVHIKGWIGFFNRTTKNINVKLNKDELGLLTYYGYPENEKVIPGKFRIYDIWNNKEYIIGENSVEVSIDPTDVLFISYEEFGGITMAS